MRQLATIRTISKLLPIEGRDRIMLAIVDGWSLIVKKEEFNVGDKCVYVEIDSVLPEREEFEFLRPKKFRIKTMKLSNVISQGICFPLSILPPKDGEYELGEDVTEILGITQYEPTMDKEPEPREPKISEKSKWPRWLLRWAFFRKLVLPKKKERKFPNFVSKTDETRIQNMPFILEDKREWIATEKIDGQSGTFALVRHKSKIPFLKDKFEYIVCSRNFRLWNKDDSSYWSVSDRYNIEEFLKKIIADNLWVAIQGECISPKVQKNKYKVKIPDLYVFNLIFPTGRTDSLTAKNVIEENGLKFVPIIATDYVLPDTVDEVLSYAHGDSALGNTIREGIVFRSKDGQSGFKAVDPLFLLKYDE